MSKKLLFFLFFIIITQILLSQEVLTGIQENVTIINTLKENSSVNPKVKNNSPLFLPFKDDFSYKGPFPCDSLWEDRYVFCNSTYQAFPPTTGVATFDAINDSGRIYSHALPLSFYADYLTSQTIRLDSFKVGSNIVSLKKSDSLFFSFFYQPQGIGDAPETDDSLVLEFYTVTDSTWRHIWSAEGTDLQNFFNLNNSYFKQVIIPVNDSILYYNKNFKFRFYNYASIGNNNLPGWSGNVDQWNIDYVYLNIGRSSSDTLYRDITFVNNATSLLKDFQSMPWEQYNVSLSANMLAETDMTISNLSDITYNYQYLYKIQDTLSNILHQYDGGFFNLMPFYQNGYQNYIPHCKPPVNFAFPSLSGFTDFTVTHILNPSAPLDISKQNDTSRFIQRFRNYYAYDDGTPEAGYGLSIVNGKAAYKFTLNKTDTLRAVDIFFNRTFDNSNVQYFNIMVWSSLNPENVIYESPLIKPVFADGINNFYTYFINEPVILNGTFYIGFKQSNANNLNIGYDRNTRGDYNLFYNVDGNWYNTMYKGSLMMRPVLGKKIYYTGINTLNNDKTLNLSVYPNPVYNGILNINLSGAVDNVEDATIKIFSVYAKEEICRKYSEIIDVSSLSPGIYFISIYNNNAVVTKKFIVGK